MPASNRLCLSYISPTFGSNSWAATVLLTIAAEATKEHRQEPASSHIIWLLSHLTWLLSHLTWLLSHLTCSSGANCGAALVLHLA